MADEKKEDPRIVQARQRAERMAKSGPGRNPEQVQQFVKETIVELKKTHWPDQQVLTKSTYIVLAFIAITAIWVGSIDFVLGKVGGYVFGTGH